MKPNDPARSAIPSLGVALLLLACIPAFAQPAKPFLLHLNGIGGERSIDHSLVRGLQAGGFNADVEFYDWTHGGDGLAALTRFEQNRKEAAKVRDILVKHAKEHPGQPIYLSCHSGGAGIAAWALEDLPADVHIESWLLIAPALSPTYDLTRALRHVDGKAYVFSSSYDTFVLSAGTKLFGTIDRKYTEAAGLNGFVRPESADPRQYAKLVPEPYQKRWMLMFGNAGSHISAMSMRFARNYIAPLLLKELAAAKSAPTTRSVAKS